MPQVTVYIRNEDIDKWKAIEKKSQWMHERLEHYYDPLGALKNSENVKVNEDGTISKIYPNKPARLETNPQPWFEEPTLVQEEDVVD